MELRPDLVRALAPGFGAVAARVAPLAPLEVRVPHIAAGLWIGTIAVLILPSFGRQQHRVTEDHLLRAYGVVMSAFPLL